MKNKKTLIILIVIIILLIILGSLVYTYMPRKTTVVDSVGEFKIDEAFEYKLCNEKCSFAKNNYYRKINFNTNIDDVNKIVNDINNESEKNHEKVLASKITDNRECAGTTNIYNYSYLSTADFYDYVGKDYIIIGVQRTEYDICAGKYETKELEVNIYDRKNKKIITQEEFMKQNNITDELANQRINEYIIDTFDDIEIPNDIDYSSKKIFKSEDGRLLISFKTNKYNSYEIMNLEI